jgi:hypothetical protein
MLIEYFNINEFWLPIKDYDSLYEVSNWGRIKSLEKVIVYSNGRRYLYEERILKVNPSNGYRTISLVREKIKQTHMVHRLVASAFKENTFNKPFVNHDSENQLHSYNILGNQSVRGEKNGSSKLNSCDITAIRYLYSTGISQSIVGKRFGVCQESIRKIINRTTWAHV